jgi:molecular chaperone GrpE
MTHHIRDHDAILSQFHDWLSQTSAEIEVLEGLADQELANEFGSSAPPTQRDDPGTPAPGGLLPLAEAFTALRHEIKLQTRGSRNLEAAVEQSLQGLDAASREFRSVQAKEREAGERAAKPLVEAIIGLDEGLLRANKAFQITCDRMTGLVPEQILQRLDQAYQELPRWKRWLYRGWYANFSKTTAEAVRLTMSPDFSSLRQGLEQIQLRLSRALQELGIVRIHESGGQVDPARMTVIEVVESDRLPAETVLEVVRPGYQYNGRVIRFAEVRATVSVRRDDAAG